MDFLAPGLGTLGCCAGTITCKSRLCISSARLAKVQTLQAGRRKMTDGSRHPYNAEGVNHHGEQVSDCVCLLAHAQRLRLNF